MRSPGLLDFEISAPNGILIEINVGQTESEFVQRVPKISIRGRAEKGMDYVYPIDWISPNGEQQTGKINAVFFMGASFIEFREKFERTRF